MSRPLALLGSLALSACFDSEPDIYRCFDGQPRPLEVVIDSTLMPPAMPGFRCSGDSGWGGGACGDFLSARAVLDGDLNILVSSPALYGRVPVVGVTERDGARLCGYRYTDVDEVSACGEPLCAASGLVTLSRFPAATSAEPIAAIVDVEFANGATMRADFAVPEVIPPP
jgi:hypothetical protein